jgi:hypothetical protein
MINQAPCDLTLRLAWSPAGGARGALDVSPLHVHVALAVRCAILCPTAAGRGTLTRALGEMQDVSVAQEMAAAYAKAISLSRWLHPEQTARHRTRPISHGDLFAVCRVRGTVDRVLLMQRRARGTDNRSRGCARQPLGTHHRRRGPCRHSLSTGCHCFDRPGRPVGCMWVTQLR